LHLIRDNNFTFIDIFYIKFLKNGKNEVNIINPLLYIVFIQ